MVNILMVNIAFSRCPAKCFASAFECGWAKINPPLDLWPWLGKAVHWPSTVTVWEAETERNEALIWNGIWYEGGEKSGVMLTLLTARTLPSSRKNIEPDQKIFLSLLCHQRKKNDCFPPRERHSSKYFSIRNTWKMLDVRRVKAGMMLSVPLAGRQADWVETLPGCFTGWHENQCSGCSQAASPSRDTPVFICHVCTKSLVIFIFIFVVVLRPAGSSRPSSILPSMFTAFVTQGECVSTSRTYQWISLRGADVKQMFHDFRGRRNTKKR